MDRPIINTIEDIVFTITVKNNANYPVNISILGNPYNPLDTVNATTEYQWNITGVDIATNQTFVLQYQAVGVSGFTNYFGAYQGNSVQDIINALNNLGIGYFNTYTSGGNTYISTYNDNYVFGNLTINGTNIVNSNFNFGSGFDVYGIFAIEDNNDKLLTSGKYNTYNGTTTNYLTKMGLDGTIDPTFNPGNAGPNNSVLSIFVDNSNNYFLCGNFQTYNLVAYGPFLKIDSFGNVDGTYNQGTGYTDIGIPQTLGCTLDVGGNVYVVGQFSAYNGTPAFNINKTDNLGTISAIFNGNAGTGLNNVGNVIKSTIDLKVIIGGSFTDYNGNTANRIIKIDKDGLVDAVTFGTGFDSDVTDIHCYASGKFLIAGAFTSYNGTAGVNRIIRLNSDATIDTTFNSGTGFNSGFVNRISVNSSGKIVAVGNFTSYNGVACNGIIRLNSDGSIDTTWVYGTGIAGTLGAATSGQGIVYLSNGTYVFVGSFTSFDGTPANGIVGLLS